MSQRVVGIGSYCLEQQIARAQKVESPQSGAALGIQPHGFLIGRSRKPGRR